MCSLAFVELDNDINNECYYVISDYMKKEVRMYRSRLGYHFKFDFRFMLLREHTEHERLLHGPGIRLREYDLFLKYLWSLSIDEYLDVKKRIYDKYKEQIKREVESFNSKEFCVLHNSDVENDEFLILTMKYFQIYFIKNMHKFIKWFEEYYNK